MSSVSDLYEYEPGYIGRKTYVSVAGHTRSIPKHKTYLGADRKRKLLPEFGGDPYEVCNTSPFYMPDKEPYYSVVDNTVIDGRAAHRDHMVRHNLIEVGNERIGQRSSAPLPGLRSDIQRAIQELS